MHESRHAAVIARAGAVAPLVTLLGALCAAGPEPPASPSGGLHENEGMRGHDGDLDTSLVNMVSACLAVISPFPDIQVCKKAQRATGAV